MVRIGFEEEKKMGCLKTRSFEVSTAVVNCRSSSKSELMLFVKATSGARDVSNNNGDGVCKLYHL